MGDSALLKAILVTILSTHRHVYAYISLLFQDGNIMLPSLLCFIS